MLLSVADDPRAVPGMVISVQTYGDQTANWHPHSHALVTDGVFRPDGSFQPLPPLDPQQLMLLFRHKLLQELLRLGKIYPATIEILDRFRHTGFSAFQGQPVLPGDTAAREKLAGNRGKAITYPWSSEEAVPENKGPLAPFLLEAGFLSDGPGFRLPLHPLESEILL